MHPLTGCSVARLSRLLWEQEAAGSNPATPTKVFSFFGKTFFLLLNQNHIVKQLSRPDRNREGRRFESGHPDKSLFNFWKDFFLSLNRNHIAELNHIAEPKSY